MIETSSEIDLITEALHGFQSQVVTVKKETTNPFFRSKYADLASIMIEAQPILTEYGLVISQFPDNIEGQPALTTLLIHCSGQFFRATIPLPISMVTVEKEDIQTGKKTTTSGFDPQEFGRAITYMRRYGFSAVTQIVIDEDDDGNRSSIRLKQENTPPLPPPDPSNPETIKKIEAIWKANDAPPEQLEVWVKKNNGDKTLSQLSGSRQLAMLKILEDKQKKQSEKNEKSK